MRRTSHLGREASWLTCVVIVLEPVALRHEGLALDPVFKRVLLLCSAWQTRVGIPGAVTEATTALSRAHGPTRIFRALQLLASGAANKCEDYGLRLGSG